MRISFHFQPPPLLRSKKGRRRERLSNFTNVNQNQKCTTTSRILKHIDELEEGWELLQKFLNSYPQSVTSSIVVIHIDWNKEEYRKGRPENRRAPHHQTRVVSKSCEIYWQNNSTICRVVQKSPVTIYAAGEASAVVLNNSKWSFLSIKVEAEKREKGRGWSYWLLRVKKPWIIPDLVVFKHCTKLKSFSFNVGPLILWEFNCQEEQKIWDFFTPD